MDSINVTIHTREGIVFQGEAQSVSSRNKRGPFDVLPMHANFVTTLYEVITVKTKNKPPFVHTLERGLLWARSGNMIDIYIGIGIGNTPPPTTHPR